MARGISMATRKEIVEALGHRYRSAPRAEKCRILDEFIALTGYHRKHAVRVLRSASSGPAPAGPSRRRVYDEAVREALVIVWEAADRICGKRLKVILPEMLAALERHGRLCLDCEVRTKLLAASAATIDRLLRPVRAKAGGRKRRRPAASSSIKQQVRVRTFADWGDVAPGFFEVDFVAHNGGSSAGSCVHTLVLTDVASAWTECIPLVAREQSLVVEGLRMIRPQLPVSLLGLNTDNDSAFLNDTLLAYCHANDIEFTRSRAYRKNDQAWVEQKNGAVVRRFVGHDRFVGAVAAQILARLYQAVRLYVNFFQPSFKLLTKERQGAKVKKTYYAPATPCVRLLANPAVPTDAGRRLSQRRNQLDPVRLLHTIREAQSALAKLSSAATGPSQGNGSLAEFLEKLPHLWRDGEVRPTHRSEPASSRWWRTRADPFESVWPMVLGWLNESPDVTAKLLLERLQLERPGEFIPGQLRTLQRRVREWRRIMARQLIYATCDPDLVLSEIGAVTPADRDACSMACGLPVPKRPASRSESLPRTSPTTSVRPADAGPTVE